MKVGDLVKFRPGVLGMENMRGIIIAFRFNGTMPLVAWASPRYTHPVTEECDFLQVISNNDESPNV